MEVNYLNRKITKRVKIFIVEEITNDAAKYFANGLNEKNRDGDTTYQVSELELIEVA